MDGPHRAVPRPVCVPAGRLPAGGDPRDPAGSIGDRLGAHRRRQDAGRRVRHHGGPGARRQRIAYTTPLKALRNQKFGDFTRAYGEERVGILTGDVKVNPHAAGAGDDHRDPPQRALRQRLRQAAATSSSTSATTWATRGAAPCGRRSSSARRTTSRWSGCRPRWPTSRRSPTGSRIVHRPIVAIAHPHRPVPLHYSVADLAGEIHEMDDVRRGRARVVGDEPRGPDDPRALVHAARGGSHRADRGAGAARLAAGDLLHLQPGRVRARDGRRAAPRAGRCHPRAAARGRRVDRARRSRDIAGHRRVGAEPDACSEALRLGVGLHHAGILPGLKRLIESLFERGLCKRGLRHRDHVARHPHAGARRRPAGPHQADRARLPLAHAQRADPDGRPRGPPRHRSGGAVRDRARRARRPATTCCKVVDGSPEPIESQFKLGYGSVAALHQHRRAATDVIRRRIESSFGQYQNLKRIREMEAEVRSLETALEAARGYAAPCGDFARIGRYRRARQEVDARRQATGRGGRRGERSPIEAEPGRLALVRRKGAPSLAVVLRVHAIRGHRVLLDALLPHGAVVRLKSGLIKRIFWATPPLNVPRDLQRGGRPDHRALKVLSDQLERLPLPELMERERSHGPEATLTSIECHRCPWGATPNCDHAWREIERLNERLSQRRQGLESFRGAYWQEFLRVVEVLEQFGALQERQLEPKGRLIASLRHENELLVAEAVWRAALRGHHAGRGGRPLLGAARGVALRRADDRPDVPQAAGQAQAQAREPHRPRRLRLPGPAGTASRHADQRPAGVHAGGLSLGLGRRRLVRHRGGLVRRPRGRSDPGYAPADRPAPPAGGQPGASDRHDPAAGAGGAHDRSRDRAGERAHSIRTQERAGRGGRLLCWRPC